MVRTILIALLACYASVAQAELTVTQKAAQTVVTTTPEIVTQVQTVDGDAVGAAVREVGPAIVSAPAPAVVVQIKSDRDFKTSLVKIKCATATVSLVEAGVYVVSTPGTHVLDVNVISEQPLQWDDELVTVVVGEGPNPPDPPGPKPPEPPTPPVPPVPNDYGIGAIAYASAPHDVATAAKMASIYRQSGDFLFGIPSLKFIVSSNQQHASDPNRSIMAWITQQYGLVQCPDVETCKQWSKWKADVRDAFLASQANRQFTRQDWYAAFNEVCKALAEVK